MISREGYELPEGTIVYLGLERTTVEPINRVENVQFVFDPRDGLWATSFTRNHWMKHPRRHPNCTLFDLLRTECMP